MKPSGIAKIEDSLKKAKSKGYKVCRVYGVFSSYVKAKKLTANDYNSNINAFNDYLKQYQLACFSNRKGMFFSKLQDYKPSYETTSLEW